MFTQPDEDRHGAADAIPPSSTRCSAPADTAATCTARICAFDSPYNTYRYPGLPPGPIASPGSGSLEAAVHPADAGYLYFVSRNDGSHAFARTLDEHNRNVQKCRCSKLRDQKGRTALIAPTVPPFS